MPAILPKIISVKKSGVVAAAQMNHMLDSCHWPAKGDCTCISAASTTSVSRKYFGNHPRILMASSLWLVMSSNEKRLPFIQRMVLRLTSHCGRDHGSYQVAARRNCL